MAKIRTALRVSAQDLNEIDNRAQQYGMTRTDYMIRASLNTLEADDNLVVHELEQIKERLARLEQQAFGY
ncbi:MAG: hypothetical protein KGL39_46470 [Patescibacteria group bacterium]|nr:hypothetical protein [Patescibacteria group bacterium]